jgi:hypothetical protein
MATDFREQAKSESGHRAENLEARADRADAAADRMESAAGRAGGGAEPTASAGGDSGVAKTDRSTDCGSSTPASDASSPPAKSTPESTVSPPPPPPDVDDIEAIVAQDLASRPSVAETVKKTRRRFWMLRHLKNHGLNEKELVTVYNSCIRSCIEFASVVYGPMLTEEQSAELEKLQGQCLKIIFGFNKSYREVRELGGVELLAERRERAIVNFAKKCTEGNFHHWFPPNERGGRARKSLKFREDFARCDRHRNTPIFYMRRALNALEN